MGRSARKIRNPIPQESKDELIEDEMALVVAVPRPTKELTTELGVDLEEHPNMDMGMQRR